MTMSTQIAEIIGRKETLILPQNPTSHTSYVDSTIYITRFYGGLINRRMLQLTISNDEGHSYIQLTEEQVNNLSKILSQSFNYEIYPSE
jgi:hypothetical protein